MKVVQKSKINKKVLGISLLLFFCFFTINYCLELEAKNIKSTTNLLANIKSNSTLKETNLSVSSSIDHSSLQKKDGLKPKVLDNTSSKVLSPIALQEKESENEIEIKKVNKEKKLEKISKKLKEIVLLLKKFQTKKETNKQENNNNQIEFKNNQLKAIKASVKKDSSKNKFDNKSQTKEKDLLKKETTQATRKTINKPSENERDNKTVEKLEPKENKTVEKVEPKENKTVETVEPKENETVEKIEPKENKTAEKVEPKENKKVETIEPKESKKDVFDNKSQTKEKDLLKKDNVTVVDKNLPVKVKNEKIQIEKPKVKKKSTNKNQAEKVRDPLEQMKKAAIQTKKEQDDFLSALEASEKALREKMQKEKELIKEEQNKRPESIESKYKKALEGFKLQDEIIQAKTLRIKQIRKELEAAQKKSMKREMNLWKKQKEFMALSHENKEIKKTIDKKNKENQIQTKEELIHKKTKDNLIKANEKIEKTSEAKAKIEARLIESQKHLIRLSKNLVRARRKIKEAENESSLEARKKQILEDHEKKLIKGEETLEEYYKFLVQIKNNERKIKEQKDRIKQLEQKVTSGAENNKKRLEKKKAIDKKELDISSQTIGFCPLQKKKVKDITSDFFAKHHKEAKSKRFSFDWEEEDLQSIFEELEEESKIPFVIGKTLQGGVNVKFKNKNVAQILDLLTTEGSYDYKYHHDAEGGYYFFGSSVPTSPDRQYINHSYYYRTKNLLPSIVIKALKPEYKKYYTVSDKLRLITINAPSKMMINILNNLRNIDRTPKQIKLDLNIFEFVRNDIKTAKLSDHSLAGMGDLLKPLWGAQGSTVVDGAVFEEFSSFIKLMRKEGKVKVGANPSLVIVEGEKANVESGWKGQSRFEYGTNNTTQLVAMEEKKGFTIEPRIAENNEIILYIQEAISSYRDETNEGVDRQKISTTIRLKANQTAIIGGMYYNKEIKEDFSIPLLSDLPVFGILFEGENKKRERHEVIFTITPKVLCNS